MFHVKIILDSYNEKHVNLVIKATWKVVFLLIVIYDRLIFTFKRTNLAQENIVTFTWPKKQQNRETCGVDVE